MTVLPARSAAASPAPQPAPTDHHDIVYPSAFGFVAVHAACLLVLVTGITWRAVLLGCVLYILRMFAITGGYHRLFSHRTFRTSRLVQFLFAFLGQSSAQSGVLWWAAQHRAHHRYSDTAEDPHSPHHLGFWEAHVGWIFRRRSGRPDYSLIPDLTRYPELVALNRNRFAPAMLLGLASFAIAGWPGVVVGFLWSTVVLYHATFAINSVAHQIGRRRYITGDDSRNNWWLAAVTMGEGWHNNHHWYQGSARQGFRWWEIDATYYVLRALAACGIVWELKEPPREVVRDTKPLPTSIVDRAAQRLAWAWRTQHRPHLPSLPTLQELRTKAESMFARTPSLETIVARARVLIAEALGPRPIAGPE